MTFFGANLMTAIATLVLAVFAVVTAWYARRAFVKQSQEVAAIEQQVKDQQEVTKQQAKLLELQAEQLELQRQQLDEQRKGSAAQAEVLQLQAAELRGSLEERKRQAENSRRAQAAKIFVSQNSGLYFPKDEWGNEADAPEALIIGVTTVNTSDQPIYNTELRWHQGSMGYGIPNPEPLGTIMPGREHKSARSFPIDTNIDVSGAVLRFTDAAGVAWMRRPDGGLTEQS